MKVLLADDELSMQALVRRIVEDDGFEFCAVDNGNEVFAAAASEKPDIILLDVMMPGMDGFHVCSVLRDRGFLVPIIILSAKGDTVDKAVGFSSGADDYLVKPFSPEELLMRIKAHLRQRDRLGSQPQVIREGELEIDQKKHLVFVKGKEVAFTPKEFGILAFLATHKGEIVTREQLIEEVWGEEYIGETSSVAVFIRKIREKIETDPSHPRLLRTLRNVGYIFGLE